jgi:hypothetical protein
VADDEAPTAAAAPRKRGRPAKVQIPTEPTPIVPDIVPYNALSPDELYRREKARRTKPADDTLMKEAKRMLEEAMSVGLGGRRRGTTITVGAAKRPQPPGAPGAPGAAPAAPAAEPAPPAAPAATAEDAEG